MIADTPTTPYYAVIFTSIRSHFDKDYDRMAERMLALAKVQPGFLGAESAREGIGITVSYWKDLDSIKAWKNHGEHSLAREKGRTLFYQSFKTRIARVESDYEFEKQ